MDRSIVHFTMTVMVNCTNDLGRYSRRARGCAPWLCGIVLPMIVAVVILLIS